MIPLFKVYMNENVSARINQVLYSGFIGEGQVNVEFENKLKKIFGNEKTLTVNAGTSALHLAYHLAINNKPNAEIISTSMTCTATNTPIVNNGAKIVWADVDQYSGNIDPCAIENCITDNTAAIVAVHWGGGPAKLDEINEIGKRYGIPVVEDAAHAMCAEYKGRPIGSVSDFTCFSFQAIKHLTAGDGGAICVKNDEDYERIKKLRWFGIDRNVKSAKDLRCEIDVVEAGYKFHMNDINATIGLENLNGLDSIVNSHRENAAFYDEAFSGIGTIKISQTLEGCKSSYWLYTIHLNNRDEVMERLGIDGIMSSKVHSVNHTHTMFRKFNKELPNTNRFADSHLCIPVGWWITKEEREFIAESVIKYAR